MTAPAELDVRLAAFLDELGTQHPAPWEDAPGETSSEDKETDR